MEKEMPRDVLDLGLALLTTFVHDDPQGYTGRTTVTVAVDVNNPAAMALYLSRDFRRLTDDDTDTDYD